MSRITTAARVEARLVTERWDWAEREAERIAAHWVRRVAERPAMFNGRVLVLAGLDRIGGGAVAARYLATDYANLVARLDFGVADDPIRNGFAMGALCGSDGRFILGRMAAHTANAGKLYFPAGTPDLGDVGKDGVVDLAGSIVREIAEETGLRAKELQADPGWTIVEDGAAVAFMKRVRLAVPAEEALARIRGFLATEQRPELSDVEIAPEDEVQVPGMPDYLRDYLDAVRSGQIE